MPIRNSIAAGLVLLASTAALAAPATPDDAYLAGYAAAVLEQRLGWAAGSYTLNVSDGRMRLDAREHPHAASNRQFLRAGRLTASEGERITLIQNSLHRQ